MFINILFKKLRIRQNKYIIALTYGLLYAILFFLIFFLSSLYLKQVKIVVAILLSIFIGICMFIVGLIKEEVFKFGKNRLKQKPYKRVAFNRYHDKR
jgi:hypothetical protein